MPIGEYYLLRWNLLSASPSCEMTDRSFISLLDRGHRKHYRFYDTVQGEKAMYTEMQSLLFYVKVFQNWHRTAVICSFRC
jgi:hypothetical protein